MAHPHNIRDIEELQLVKQLIITPSLGSIEMDIQTISNRKLDDVYFGVIWLVQPQAKQPEYVHTYRHTHTHIYIYIYIHKI